jgi:hypothetical protein
MHPAVVDRLTKDMNATAALLDSADAQSMAADEPWKAMKHLQESVVALTDEAEMYRPHT